MNIGDSGFETQGGHEPSRHDLLDTEAKAEQDYLLSDLASYVVLIEKLKENEIRELATEIPAEYGNLGNNDDNPLHWAHLLSTAALLKGYDIRFSEDAYLLTHNKDIRPGGRPLKGLVGVYVHTDQYDQLGQLGIQGFYEGGALHRLLTSMCEGRIDATYLNPENFFVKVLAKGLDPADIHSTGFLAEQKERWGYIEPTEDDDSLHVNIKNVDDLFNSGLIQRAFLTSRLFVLLATDKPWRQISDADKIMYKKLRQEGFTPFNPEELIGMAVSVVRGVQRRYPGLTPKPSVE